MPFKFNIILLIFILLFSANFCYAADSSNKQPFADKAMSYAISLWQTRIFPFISDIWVKTSGFLNKEIGNRPDIKNKLESEKKEVEQEVPQLVVPFWDKIKGLIK